MARHLSRAVAAILQILALLAVARASVHIVKLVALVIFGLGGLVLYQAVASGSPLGHISTAVGKRSLSEWSRIGRMGSAPTLASALQLDDKECARLYLCEMQASGSRDDKLAPAHLRAWSDEDRAAQVEFSAAAEYGREHRSSAKCRQKYRKCPYKSVKQMLSIINQYQNL